MWIELRGGSCINNWNFFDLVATWILRFSIWESEIWKMTCLFIRMVHQLMILEPIWTSHWSNTSRFVSRTLRCRFEASFDANSMKNVLKPVFALELEDFLKWFWRYLELQHHQITFHRQRKWLDACRMMENEHKLLKFTFLHSPSETTGLTSSTSRWQRPQMGHLKWLWQKWPIQKVLCHLTAIECCETFPVCSESFSKFFEKFFRYNIHLYLKTNKDSKLQYEIVSISMQKQ